MCNCILLSHTHTLRIKLYSISNGNSTNMKNQASFFYCIMECCDLVHIAIYYYNQGFGKRDISDKDGRIL